jgi:hypothetical protein
LGKESFVRRTLAAVAAGAALVATGASASQAAPPQGNNDVFDLTCGARQIQVYSQAVGPKNQDKDVANFTPAFVVGTHEVVIPYTIDITASFQEQSFRFTQTKPAPVPANAVTCTVTGATVSDAPGATFSGTVVLVFRGHR